MSRRVRSLLFGSAGMYTVWHGDHRSKKGREKHNWPYNKARRRPYKQKLEKLRLTDLENAR